MRTAQTHLGSYESNDTNLNRCISFIEYWIDKFIDFRLKIAWMWGSGLYNCIQWRHPIHTYTTLMLIYTWPMMRRAIYTLQWCIGLNDHLYLNWCIKVRATYGSTEPTIHTHTHTWSWFWLNLSSFLISYTIVNG